MYSEPYQYTLPHSYVETFRIVGCLATVRHTSILLQVNILAELEGKALCMVIGDGQELYREERKASTKRTPSPVNTSSPPAATIGELRSKPRFASCAGRGLGTLSCCMEHSCIGESTKPGTFLK